MIHTVADEVISALYEHGPKGLLARLWVDHNNVIRIKSEADCEAYALRLELRAEIAERGVGK